MMIMLGEETKEEYIQRVASSGGKANIAKHGKKFMKRISKKGVEARRGKPKSKLKKLLFD